MCLISKAFSAPFFLFLSPGAFSRSYRLVSSSSSVFFFLFCLVVEDAQLCSIYLQFFRQAYFEQINHSWTIRKFGIASI